MDSAKAPRRLSGESLVKLGSSLRILAVSVILVLSAGMMIIVYGQLREGNTLAEAFNTSPQVLSGFAFLMLLTVGYLVGKGRTTTRVQKQLIDELLEEEAIARAQRLNPITQFHHPDVCRDMLLRQASYAGRMHSPLSIVELTMPNFEKLSKDSETQALIAELARQARRLCRPIDALVRWSPDSFLLVFPEVSQDELPAISYRIVGKLEQWCQQHFEVPRPSLQWRYVTSENLGTSGDILAEIHRLFEQDNFSPSSKSNLLQPNFRREKSVALALILEVRGTDEEGNSFRETVVTERVAADRVWFPLKKRLAEESTLTIILPDGNSEETVKVSRLVERPDENLVEAQFTKTPENWVVRSL
ncbi:MAG: GGDEF domain-containing protein [Acidobacteria bacterium]|nr:GGDEF domain-containing protein [Acidobacteriota bacterium]